MPRASSQTLASILFLLLPVLLQPASAQVAAASGTQTSAPSTTTAACDRYRHTGFWDVDIDNYPDLPPDCGPPFSANADRDPDHLPIQLVTIFASYLALTVFVGSSILTIRLQRKKKLHNKEAIELHLVEKSAFDPKSPSSPAAASIVSWMRNPLKKRTGGAGEDAELRSPGIDSIASFDFKVIESDRANREAELDRLYAAVAAQDTLRRSEVPVSDNAGGYATFGSAVERASPPPPAPLPRASMTSTARSSRALTETTAGAPPGRMSAASTLNSRPTDRRLARVAHAEIPRSPGFSNQPGPSRQFDVYDLPEDGGDENGYYAAPKQAYPQSPAAYAYPLSPVGYTHPLSPASGYGYHPAGPAGKVQLPNDMYPASPPPRERRMQLPGQQPFSPAGIMSPASTVFSPGLPSARSVYQEESRRPNPAMNFPGGLPLSPQVHKFSERPTSTAVRAAMTRRHAPAITVNTNLQVRQGDENDLTPLSASFDPTTPSAAEWMGSPDSSPEEYVHRPPPVANPSPAPSMASGRQQRKPPTLNLGGNASSSSLQGMTLGLPPRPSTGSLRHPQQPAAGNSDHGFPSNAAATAASKPLPLRAAFDTTPADLQSPGAFKTTILQPRQDAFMRGPRTGRMTPMTAIPPTPYSAYMPFTPVTPITPHLVTRKERKDKRKQEGRMVLDESDIVKEDDDEEAWNER